MFLIHDWEHWDLQEEGSEKEGCHLLPGMTSPPQQEQLVCMSLISTGFSAGPFTNVSTVSTLPSKFPRDLPKCLASILKGVGLYSKLPWRGGWWWCVDVLLVFLFLLCLFTRLLGLSRRGERVEGAGEKLEKPTSSHVVGIRKVRWNISS